MIKIKNTNNLLMNLIKSINNIYKIEEMKIIENQQTRKQQNNKLKIVKFLKLKYSISNFYLSFQAEIFTDVKNAAKNLR